MAIEAAHRLRSLGMCKHGTRHTTLELLKDPILCMRADIQSPRIAEEPVWETIFPSREDWLSEQDSLPATGECWYTEGSKTGGLSRAGYYRSRRALRIGAVSRPHWDRRHFSAATQAAAPHYRRCCRRRAPSAPRYIRRRAGPLRGVAQIIYRCDYLQVTKDRDGCQQGRNRKNRLAFDNSRDNARRSSTRRSEGALTAADFPATCPRPRVRPPRSGSTISILLLHTQVHTALSCRRKASAMSGAPRAPIKAARTDHSSYYYIFEETIGAGLAGTGRTDVNTAMFTSAHHSGISRPASPLLRCRCVVAPHGADYLKNTARVFVIIHELYIFAPHSRHDDVCRGHNVTKKSKSEDQSYAAYKVSFCSTAKCPWSQPKASH
ncbi:unnamed protein product [Trichogramma brassicae]|uniref:Uncharacterized protein n=1 Tax=Trichogramma brassicae TaxID=86971 RepID=A0A6H5ILH8_9HYME|nr:unnamed protein product [Trichogramma brassicae]